MRSAFGVAGAVMGQWIFAEYAWTLFVRADLEAQVLLSHLVYRKSWVLRAFQRSFLCFPNVKLSSSVQNEASKWPISLISASWSSFFEGFFPLPNGRGLFLRLEDSPYTVGDLQNHFSTDCTKLLLVTFISCSYWRRFPFNHHKQDSIWTN